MGIQVIDTFGLFEDTLAQTSGARGVTTVFRTCLVDQLLAQTSGARGVTTQLPWRICDSRSCTDLWSQRGYDL